MVNNVVCHRNQYYYPQHYYHPLQMIEPTTAALALYALSSLTTHFTHHLQHHHHHHHKHHLLLFQKMHPHSVLQHTARKTKTLVRFLRKNTRKKDLFINVILDELSEPFLDITSSVFPPSLCAFFYIALFIYTSFFATVFYEL